MSMTNEISNARGGAGGQSRSQTGAPGEERRLLVGLRRMPCGEIQNWRQRQRQWKCGRPKPAASRRSGGTGESAKRAEDLAFEITRQIQPGK